jgi:hypothetical protein
MTMDSSGLSVSSFGSRRVISGVAIEKFLSILLFSKMSGAKASK